MSALGVGGFLLGLCFLLSWNERSIYGEFQHLSVGKPEPFLWCLLVSAQVGMWFILITVLYQPLHAHRKIARLRTRTLLCVLTSILIMFSILLLIRHYPEGTKPLICYQTEKVIILTLIGFIPFLLSLSGLYLAGAAAEQANPTSGDFATDVRALMKISRDLQTFLIVTGLIIGAATISTGVLEKAMNLRNPEYEPSVIYALLYGAFGTSVIVLLYLPAYAALRDAGTRLCDSVLPLPANANAVPDWLDNRQKLNSLFGLDKSALESLKTGIAILTPILAGAGSFIAFK